MQADFTKFFSDAHARAAALAVGCPARPELRSAWHDGSFDGYPIDFDSPFLAGSLAKLYTAACIRILVQSHLLALSEPVHRYVPECPRGIDVLELLTHTSGLGDHVTALVRSTDTFHWAGQSTAELVALAQRRPGARGAFGYSNTGYLLLALLIERIGDRSLADFAAVELFTPLGLHNTCYIDRRTAVARALLEDAHRELLAAGQSKVDPFQLLDLSKGSGNLISSLNDALSFGRALLSGHSHPHIEPCRDDNPLAGMEEFTISGRRLFGHRAQFLATRSAVLVEPASGTVVAYCIRHRVRPDLKPSRALLTACEKVTEWALADEARLSLRDAVGAP